jgi:hypothetical protein
MKNFSDGINPALIDDPIARRNWAVVKEFSTEVQRALAKIIPAVNNPTGSVSTIVPVAPIINTRVQHAWHANGPYRVDTAVDGGIMVPTSMVLTAVKLHRTTPGSSGSTSIDINKNGSTMYITNPASKPAIGFGSTVFHAVLPSDTTLSAGDVITIDIDAIEAGNPANLTVTIEGA